MSDPAALKLERDGVEFWPAAATDCLDAIETAVGSGEARPGRRLAGDAALGHLLAADGPIGSRVKDRLEPGMRPVRAVLFDKTLAANWALGWHQDRTIVVRERREVPGYGPWTAKAGLIHVAPPTALLAAMVTIRIHLDPVPADNAPLLVACGSHRLGRVPEPEIADAVAACGTVACLAERGDIWAYRTLVLHASDAARRAGRRRVLQVDYAAQSLPGGLEWLGV